MNFWFPELWFSENQLSVPIRANNRNTLNHAHDYLISIINGWFPSRHCSSQKESILASFAGLFLVGCSQLPAEECESVFVFRWGIASSSWVFPVKIQTIKAPFPQMSNGRVDEDLSLLSCGYHLREFTSLTIFVVPTANSEKCLQSWILLFQGLNL